MCGFAGEVRRDGAPDTAVLERMGEVLAPRGPDGHGLWRNGRVGLVHRRLAIIDLSDLGAQPMGDDELGLTITFNGIIYNHRELRAELEREGHTFRSHSDTEVLLRGWAAWGEGVLEKLKGMFAFALVERDSGRVVLARDRLGKKPLYVAEGRGGVLRFASTLPALLAAGDVDTSIDPVALHHFLSWHSIVPAPRTILQGVRKLPPATVRIIERDGTSKDRLYWDPPFARDPGEAAMDAADWADAVREALRVAVRRRMVSDVPVGILLSGGLDSSLIVALLAQEGQKGLATFSIGFDAVGEQEGDEFFYSDLVAREFETDHHKIHIPVGDLVEALPHAIRSMSEPMTSHDCVAFWLLSREVAKSRKVVQSGQGADEVLGGYFWYQELADTEGHGASDYRAAFFDRTDAEIQSVVGPDHRVTDDPSGAFLRAHFGRPGADTPVDRALRVDTEVMLVDDPVKRVDNMTMAHGLEARTPFLDHDLVELAARCPPELKLAQDGKGVLKDASRGVVPDAVIDREKGYFPVPALSHLEEPVLTFVREALHAPSARERALYVPERVDAMLRDPNAHTTNIGSSAVWQMALLELWLQEHVG
ncbi:N-acetylglutaminylglutamine amidotransferase [Conexibacter sp. SYSU D00693]|uniref:N-acetylglutaminylglutamine amidotransferase n=1 Tax=Conexibacter sp. SYSU D00693 TaxID=2812560 RepID=UPI00196AC4DE|nr:N-acetylglutaminylglutamine amidotransferase [Conexibacter sp. SYSU D00693]